MGNRNKQFFANLMRKQSGVAITMSVAALYFFAARIGLLLAFEQTNASPVWPPSGLAFALALMFGRRVYPGILLGAFCANLTVFSANQAAPMVSILVASLAIACGNTVETICGMWLIRRFGDPEKCFSRLRGALHFLGVSAVMCLCGATVGATILTVVDIIPFAMWSRVWFTWWLGDVSGIVVLTPTIVCVAWYGITCFGKSWGSWVEPFGLCSTACGLAAIIFLTRSQPAVASALVTCLLPLILWSAFRFNQTVTAFVATVISVFAITGTTMQLGPFIHAPLNASLISLQIFVCVVAVKGIVLSATIAESRAMREQVSRLNHTLEDQVQQRTEALKSAKEFAEGASRSKSDFLMKLSHELRTPMNGVLGMAEIIRCDPLNSEQTECLDALQTAAGSMLTMINEMLDFSELDQCSLTLNSTPFDFRLRLSHALHTFPQQAFSKGLAFEYRIDDDVPDRLFGDSRRITQVLINLIGNAIKFTENGGIIFEVQCLEQTLETATLQFSVSDTGIGIDGSHHSRIFAAFEQADNSMTRSYGGTGLGLTVANQLVTRMGGQIRLESQPSAGSRFYFAITLQKEILELVGANR